MAKSKEELKSLLIKVKEESEKVGLKLNIQDSLGGPVAKTLSSQCWGPGFDPLSVQGTLKNLLQHHSSTESNLWCSAFFMAQFSHPHITTGKKCNFD